MLSLVIPIFNEEKLIDELVKRTVAALESFISEYEVIFVDDGSTDQSLSRILVATDLTRIKVLHYLKILVIRLHLLLVLSMLKVIMLR